MQKVSAHAVFAGLKSKPCCEPNVPHILDFHHISHPSGPPSLPTLFLRWKTELCPWLAVLRAHSVLLGEKGCCPMMTHVAGGAWWDLTLTLYP